MELCAGGDLDKHMRAKQGGPYTERQAGHRDGGSRGFTKPWDPGRDPHGADLDICSWAVNRTGAFKTSKTIFG